MDEITRPPCAGLHMKDGTDINRVVGYGYEQLDGLDDWHFTQPSGFLKGQFWVRVECADGKTRDLSPDQICCFRMDPDGRENFDKVIGGLTHYLNERGRWYTDGWVPTGALHGEITFID